MTISMLDFIKTNRSAILLTVILGCIVYFPIFLRLDSKPLREWDEARNAINAYEMSHDQNLLIRTYNEQPDLWETKPPLLVWLQLICFKIFGTSEAAVRLPSAIATFSLTMFFLFFFKRYFDAPFAGFFSALVLITTHGFIFEHCTRTGDHDALLVFFEMLMLFNFYLYLTFKKNTYLLIFSLCLFFGILTKSISSFMFFPGLLLYLLFSGQFIKSLKDKKLWMALILSLAGSLTYYAVREYYAKGYLSAVWENELFPRYFNTSETYQYNPRDTWFYFRQINETQFSEWYKLIVPAIIFNEICSKPALKKFHHFVIINALLFFIVISNGTTNSSYVLPLIPLLSVIIGIAFYNIGQIMLDPLAFNLNLKILMLFLLVLSIFYKPYDKIIGDVMDKTDPNMQVHYGYALKRMEKENPAIKQFYIYEPTGCNYPAVFYKKVFNAEKNYKITITKDVKPDSNTFYMLILTSNLPKMQTINTKYDIVMHEEYCCLIKVLKETELVE